MLTANMIITAVIGLALVSNARSGIALFPGLPHTSRKERPVAYWAMMLAWTCIFAVGVFFSVQDYRRGPTPIEMPMKMAI